MDPALYSTDKPVAVYDIEQKKLILLFQTFRTCSQYLFCQNTYPISALINRKHVNENNFFKKKLAFRYANDKQKEMLNEGEYQILDMEYDRPDWRPTPRFMNRGPIERTIMTHQSKAAYKRKKTA